MNERSGTASGKDPTGFSRRFRRLKPQRGRPLPTQPDTKKQKSPKRWDTDIARRKPRIPIWIDGQGEIEVEIPRGVPGGYHGQIVDLRYLDQAIGEKRRKFEATMVVGNLHGQTGVGSGKSESAAEAVKQAMKNATANTFKVLRKQTTLAETIKKRTLGVEVIISPAKSGSGISAPPSVQTLLELAGINDAAVSLPENTDIDDVDALKIVARALRLQTHIAQRREREQSTRVSRYRTDPRDKSRRARLSPLRKKRTSK